MQKSALGSDISNTASEEERKFNKILGIQGQAFIMRERESGLERVLKCQEKVEKKWYGGIWERCKCDWVWDCKQTNNK